MLSLSELHELRHLRCSNLTVDHVTVTTDKYSVFKILTGLFLKVLASLPNITNSLREIHLSLQAAQDSAEFTYALTSFQNLRVCLISSLLP